MGSGNLDRGLNEDMVDLAVPKELTLGLSRIDVRGLRASSAGEFVAAESWACA